MLHHKKHTQKNVEKLDYVANKAQALLSLYACTRADTMNSGVDVTIKKIKAVKLLKIGFLARQITE